MHDKYVYKNVDGFESQVKSTKGTLLSLFIIKICYIECQNVECQLKEIGEKKSLGSMSFTKQYVEHDDIH